MTARFSSGSDFLEITSLLCSAEEVQRGNPYNSTFDITVRSGAFCGTAGCEYDIRAFSEFVDQLGKLYDFEVRSVVLQDICYGSKVTFCMDHTGHMQISGQIYGQAMEHALKFLFHADQTALKPFLEDLERLLHQTESV